MIIIMTHPQHHDASSAAPRLSNATLKMCTEARDGDDYDDDGEIDDEGDKDDACDSSWLSCRNHHDNHVHASAALQFG